MPVAVAVFAGLLALMCILGVDVLNKAIGGLLSSIPLIGGALAKTVQFDAALVGWMWSHVQPITQAILLPHVNHATEQGLNVVAHQATHDALLKVHAVTIPQAAAAATQAAISYEAPFVAGVNGFIAGVKGFITYADGQIGALHTATDVTLPQAIAAVGPAIIHQVQALGYVSVTDLNNARAAVERDIASAAAGAQAGAVRQLAPVIGQVQTAVGGLTQEVTGVLAPGLAGVLALVTPLVGRVTQVEECTAGICSTGSGNTLGDLGKVLGGLGTLLDDGLLFALVAAAIADPVAVADGVQAVMGPIADGARVLFDDATGAAA